MEKRPNIKIEKGVYKKNLEKLLIFLSKLDTGEIKIEPKRK